jgi:aspartate-semialdehyde dehydrogenase
LDRRPWIKAFLLHSSFFFVIFAFIFFKIMIGVIMKKIQCAVLGATGVVGQHFIRLLSGHPLFQVAAVCASEGRIGQKLGEIQSLTPEGIPPELAELTFSAMDPKTLLAKKIQVAFSALPADIAVEVEKETAKAGIHIFSNAAAYRMDPQVPILIPEVNHSHLLLAREQMQNNKGFIVTNANCTTTGLALSLLPILPFGIRRLIMSSYQAISGAGYPGVSAMDISGNVIPFINGEEAKVRQECAKIFGQVEGTAIQPVPWEVYSHCVRVPTLVGHLLSVHVELESTVTQEQVAAAFESYQPDRPVQGLPTAPIKPVVLTREKNRPQPSRDGLLGEPDRSRGMAVAVGRLEADKNIIRFVTLSNNLIRGAAGGSVLNAELALREGLL